MDMSNFKDGKTCLYFFSRYNEEFFKGVYGDIILIVYGFPVVLLYIILALGKVNLVEHGVGLFLCVNVL